MTNSISMTISKVCTHFKISSSTLINTYQNHSRTWSYIHTQGFIEINAIFISICIKSHCEGCASKCTVWSSFLCPFIHQGRNAPFQKNSSKRKLFYVQRMYEASPCHAMIFFPISKRHTFIGRVPGNPKAWGSIGFCLVRTWGSVLYSHIFSM